MKKINGIFIEGKAWWTGFEVESAKRRFRIELNKINDPNIIMLDESVHSKVFNSHKMPEKFIMHEEHKDYDNLLMCGKSLGAVNVYQTFKHLFDNHFEFLKSRKSITLVFADAYGFVLEENLIPYSHKKVIVIPDEWKKLSNLKIINAYQRVRLDPFMGAYMVGADKQYEFKKCDNKDFNDEPHMNFMAHSDWKKVINNVMENFR